MQAKNSEMDSEKGPSGLREIIAAYGERRVITMGFLGFSAGLPLLLIFSSLSIWLTEAGVERSAVTLFSWAALGYSFKFVWAPLIDKLPLPWLTHRLGRRRAWLLTAQVAIAASIAAMALTDPADHLYLMAVAATVLGFSSATQDIVIDAFRIESAPPRLQALMSSAYIAGYRIGMLAAGAGALKLAAAFASGDGYDYAAWQAAYLWMAAAMAIGMATTLVAREPRVESSEEDYMLRPGQYARFLALFAISVAAFVAGFILFGAASDPLQGILTPILGEGFAGLIGEALRLGLAIATAVAVGKAAVSAGLLEAGLFSRAYVEPATDFFHRYGRLALLILLLVGLYRISDIVLGVVSNVFYTEMGYSKDQIANIAKTFGLFMTLAGGFLGGGLALRFGVMRILLLGALLSSLTNLLFVLLASSAPSSGLLTLVIAADNLSAGLASAAFVAYLSGLTNISFTAFQYAVFSSLMTLFPKTLGGYSGAIIDQVGYPHFFVGTALLGLPIMAVIWYLDRLEQQGAD
jgi:PAT family beta-lactamase induction signal transducer AmpG